MTFAQVADEAAARLEAAGHPLETARLDAALFARSVLGWDAARWLAHRTDEARPDFASRLEPLVERRRRHEPVAYILGRREFYGRAFAVTRDVLVPRPETELMIDQALALAPDLGPGPRLADVGTGSGCLAVTLAIELPAARVVATDVSPAALDVARRNAETWNVADRIEWQTGAWLAGAAGPFALIVANPPYVPERDRATLPREVMQFEPSHAIFAGPDGLDGFRALVPAAAFALAPGGWLLMEMGHDQSAAVARLIERTPGLEVVSIVDDLHGIPRVVAARRSPAAPNV
jgi:release factor glutamine methyltransferase